MERYGEIYIITCKINGKQYIGQTIRSIKKRMQEHVKSSKDPTCQYPISKAIGKYGIKNFEIIPFATCFNREALDDLEIFLIQEYETLSPKGYNLRDGGFSHACHKETKEKLSKIASKENLSLATIEKMSLAKKGKKQSADWVEARIAPRRGRPLSEEAKNHIAKGNLGKKMSEEAKKKMSLAKIGKRQSPEAIKRSSERRKRPVIDQYGKVYLSLQEAAAAIGVKPSNISAIVHGKQRSAMGYIFKFYVPEQTDPSLS